MIARTGIGGAVVDSDGFSFSDVDADSLTADEFQEMETDRLEEIYSGASAPTVEEISGKYRATILAGAAHDYLPSPLKKAWSMFASSPIMPWKGLEFEPGGMDDELGGKNLLVSVDKPVKMFPFVGRVEPSELDGADCIALDYDVGGNPIGIRQLRDEVRKVNSFLFLCRSTILLRGEQSFLLYFCMEPEY